MSQKRKITIWNSGGQQGKVVETSALNWGDLQRDLSSAGVSASGMKAVIGKTKTNLEHKEAVLPDEDFTLFLFPEKTKSGLTGKTPAQVEAMSFGEIRSVIKGLMETDGESFKAFINEGKNYTNKTTSELKALLVLYTGKGTKGNTPGGTAPEPVKATKSATKELPKTKETATKTERVQRTAVPEPVKEEAQELPRFKTDKEKANFMVDLIGTMESGEYEKSQAIDAIAGLLANGEVKGKSNSPIDAKSLKDEAYEISKGLSGIR